jgi:hypothetical protein
MIKMKSQRAKNKVCKPHRAIRYLTIFFIIMSQSYVILNKNRVEEMLTQNGALQHSYT